MTEKDFSVKKITKVYIKVFILIALISSAVCMAGCVRMPYRKIPLYTYKGAETPDIQETNKPQNTELPAPAEGILKVHFIDVGQGDSIFIQQGEKTMLIDAGEGDQGTVVTKYLNSLNVDNIDYLVGTHPHSDHIGGLATVINSIPVNQAIIPDIEHDTKTYENFIDALIDKEIDTLPATAGDKYSLGEAEFEILGPVRDDYEDLNNWSIVIKLTFGENSFLFTGDAESFAETDIINSGGDLSADVLKVGHHGSTTSSTLKFLRKVSPTYAVISCGIDNSYGHPDPIITKRLANMKITTYSTHTSGTVIAMCDGKTITIETER